MSEPAKIVVAGAGGFVGAALRRELVARGHRVVRLVRRPTGAETDLARWNPTRGVDDPDALEDAAAVIHLGGENLAAGLWTPARKRRLQESRIGSTHVLAETLARLARPPAVFLTASAVGWYGDRGDELLDEASAAGTGFLAELCADWEAAAAPARAAGIRWCALRFGIVLGPGGALAKMLPAFRLGLGAVLGDGTQYLSWISLDDAVGATVRLLDADLDGPVNVVGPAPVTNRAFTKALAAALGRPAPFRAPAFVLAPLGEMGRATLLASQRAVPVRLTEAGYGFRHPELPAALRRAVRPQNMSGIDAG